MKNIFTAWLLPLLIGVALFLTFKPTTTNIFAQGVDIAQYLASNDVNVDSDVIDGYQQVYFIYNGEKYFVTDTSSLNSYQSNSAGEYIVWVTSINGAGQIYRHHIPTGKTVQITNSSSNGLPKVDREGNVVWERWVKEVGDDDGEWQIYLFDGQAVRQVTAGEPSFNPDVEGGKVIYSQKGQKGNWLANQFDISSYQTELLKTSIDAKYLYFSKGEIIFGLPKGYKPPRRSHRGTTSTQTEPTVAQEIVDGGGEEITPTMLQEPEENEEPTPTITDTENSLITPTPVGLLEEMDQVTEKEIVNELESLLLENKPTPTNVPLPTEPEEEITVEPIVSETPTPTMVDPTATPEITSEPTPEEE